MTDDKTSNSSWGISTTAIQWFAVIWIAIGMAMSYWGIDVRGYFVNRFKQYGGDEAADSRSNKVDDTGGSDTRSWSAPEPVDVTQPDDESQRSLTLTEAMRLPQCAEIFEPEGSPAESFPVPKRKRARVLAGCRPEAYRRDDEGRRWIAYAIPNDAPSGTDLRILYYDREGALNWSHRLDRTDHANHFEANVRESFVVPLLPHVVCGGTLWAGATQVACLGAQNGEREWQGELAFWSGMPLRGHETSLVGADISGLTQRYPYSGVEMERREFEARGGHAGLYLYGPNHLLLAPDGGGPKRLTAYTFDRFERQWRTKLPGHPDSNYNDGVFPELDIAVLKIDETIYGLDLSDGSVRWAHETRDRSPIVALDETLYMLVRRDDEDNLLYALKPQSGEVQWHAPVPTGMIHLHAVEGKLILRSIRAVRRVERNP